MKLKFKKPEIFLILQNIQGIIHAKNISPILEHVLVQIEANQIKWRATDLEIEKQYIMKMESPISPSTDLPFSFTVNARRLFDIVKYLDDESEIELSIEEQNIRIKADRSSYKLMSMDPNQFPQIREIEKNNTLSITEKDFYFILSQSAYAMGVEEIRYYLNGLYLEFNSKYIRSVTTDCYRMVVSTLNHHESITETQECSVIIPRKGVNELINSLNKESSAPIDIILSKHHIQVALNNGTFTSKLIDAKYLNYENAIPQSTQTEVSFNRKRLKLALDRIDSLLRLEKGMRQVQLSLTENTLTLEGINFENETGIDSLNIEYSGEPLLLNFNIKYLFDVIHNCNTDNILMKIQSENAGVVFFNGGSNETLHLVMPLQA